MFPATLVTGAKFLGMADLRKALFEIRPCLSKAFALISALKSRLETLAIVGLYT